MNRLFALLLILTTAVAYSQKVQRIRPGQRYGPGEVIQAPFFGFSSKVPDGWEGVLPRDTETFLMLPMSGEMGEIYVFGTNNDSIDKLKQRWTTGTDMGSNITLKAKGPLVQRGEAWGSDGVLSGSTNQNDRKIYAEARCSSFGACITFMMLSDKNRYEAVKKTMQSFVDAAVFSEPKTVSIYEGFDWKEFLTDKVLMTYFTAEKQRSLNEVHFCSNGAFYSSIKRQGLLKGNLKEYQGSKTGTWTVTTGQRAELVLTFTKAPQATIELYIDDEKVYANGERHYVGASDKCKK